MASSAPAPTRSRVPRPDYPRPQAVRPDWLNLNGEWEFEIDQGDSGLERGLRRRSLRDRIVVPFAPESTASGIGLTDFLHAVWYRRTVVIPEAWKGRDVLLHFGAVDHDATVWVNDVEVGRHRGGFSPFTVPLSGVVSAGEEATIVVRARDTPGEPQARGKQSTRYANNAAHYTRTTGIWQTVWLEPVPPQHIRSLHIVPRRADGAFDVTIDCTHLVAGLVVTAELRDEQGPVVSAAAAASDLAPRVVLDIPGDRVRAWSPDDPHLYDLIVRLQRPDGTVVDQLDSYAGLRSVAIEGNHVLINGKPVFQRLVLDQGLWPETLMTAPDDAAFVRDIELSLAAGFNGARLHQKVFEERYLYHADRLGYLVWGEFGDWGVSGHGVTGHNQQPPASFITQWLEVLRRDRNHPAIIGWCPLNETYQVLHDRITQLDDVTQGMYLATKAADPTRPVLDASGYSHRMPGADIYDSHSYEQDPDAFRRQQAGLAEGRPFVNLLNGQTISLPYAGQPFFISEYGGIWWNPGLAADSTSEQANDRTDSWGYGDRVRTVEEWYDRYDGLTSVLLEDPGMFGYCFTQLTDTFQEENGIYDVARRPKFDVARIRAVQQRKASYETGPDA
jgi:beta-galactosidase/beta-glucuronidase